MESDKEKRNRAEDLLNEFKQESSKIDGLDPPIQHYLDMRFNKIEELMEKILKRLVTILCVGSNQKTYRGMA